jgi:dienelactone hydrolase
MLSLATTFDKLKWDRLNDEPARSVTGLAKALRVWPHKIHGTDRKRLSLREVMSAGWEKVTFTNDGLNLVGYLFKPPGPGPFPAVIWNHGSENLGRETMDDGETPIYLDLVADDDAANKAVAWEFGNVAEVLVPAGYVVFAPVRRGQGASEGHNIRKLVDNEKKTKGATAAGILSMQYQEGPQLSDQLAGLKLVKSLPFVDKQRLAVFGCSHGGIQTLLGAESGVGYKAAIAMSPGAETWNRDVVRLRLMTAVQRIDKEIAVLLIHPKNDASLEPGYTLGRIFEQQPDKPYGLIIFPPYGNRDETDGKKDQTSHCFGGDGGKIWAAPVLEFLKWAFTLPTEG